MASAVCVISGGVGAARLLRGAIRAVPAERVAAIVNVGDDTTFHGLRVCPDLDTILYTLSESVNPETGWGLAGETWQAIGALRQIAAANDRGDIGWFGLGDKDLGTHLYRTHRLGEGASLTAIPSTPRLAATCVSTAASWWPGPSWSGWHRPSW